MTYEVIPTPVHTVQLARQSIEAQSSADIYAGQNWRYSQAKQIGADQYLDINSDEHVRYAMQLHWIGLVHAVFGLPNGRMLNNFPVLRGKVRRVIIGALLSLVFCAIFGLWLAQLLLLVITLAHMGHMVWRMLGWKMASVIVTNRRLICPKGVFSRSVASTQLHRIGDHEYYQSILGRWLGYGTLRIETGGRHDNGAERELIRWVKSPEVVDQMISK